MKIPASSTIHQHVFQLLANLDLAFIGAGDAICNYHAGGSLPGTYTAWLSDFNGGSGNQIHARDRVFNSPVPYVMPDGAKIADNWNDLITKDSNDEFLQNVISSNEDGNTVAGNRWTGTTTGGNSNNFESDCEGWETKSSAIKGMQGRESTERFWTRHVPVDCDTTNRLICFQN